MNLSSANATLHRYMVTSLHCLNNPVTFNSAVVVLVPTLCICSRISSYLASCLFFLFFFLLLICTLISPVQPRLLHQLLAFAHTSETN
ncbi:hypothetical protein F4809DRAFT_159002 [Biscogniauxia mediterranea]|nr:hypothetical protein F4809DRAFT_159002 [Biscogniauxia mediterranea]